ncbi:aminoglycoside phosphotransferase family protein [Alkalihalobacterium chitinilyticum]|uniref:Aminoglycoside phosphotransferase family protein n=1 Tax=Alkalihalobacterium chitinilyticum TaxID=2980103 RepID=A0ABT5V8H9_9BACI|nr:aminoglycoside phosphotransferase family protein [Alkalihalobacterium chitinilyticum]MDE5411772.1 aminoglycoside phosphotransferase family protein [Alkalihalobacterium chitinilyticum]
MKLQEQFVRNVRHCFKERGDIWLNKLPDLIRYCEQKWSLRIEEPYSLSINYVAPAKKVNGQEVVVKLCLPGDDFLAELEALQLFQDRGIVQLLAFDQEQGILILEKILPGQELADVTDDEAACLIAADLFKNLMTEVPKKTRIGTTKKREEKLREIVKSHPHGLGPISRVRLKNALKVFTYLNATIERHWLLHGDFHPYNILLSNDGNWKVIDPKGLLGEAEYDLIQFLLNKLPEDGSYEVMKNRVDVFTQQLQLNKKRMILWGYCHAVLATSWSVNGTQYSTSFFKGIGIFERLFTEYYGTDIDI